VGDETQGRWLLARVSIVFQLSCLILFRQNQFVPRGFIVGLRPGVMTCFGVNAEADIASRCLERVDQALCPVDPHDPVLLPMKCPYGNLSKIADSVRAALAAYRSDGGEPTR
jgi:hypothetical protein